MSIFTCLRLMLVSLDHRQGFVLRHPIYNQVLHVAISLLAHTIQGTLQYTFGIKRTGNNRELNHR